MFVASLDQKPDPQAALKLHFRTQTMRFHFIQLLLLALAISLVSCGTNSNKRPPTLSASSPENSAPIINQANGEFKAYATKSPVRIDGLASDPIWTNADWYGMNYRWLGDTVDSADYHGKFKLAWDSQYLYVLVEVVDNVLTPTLESGLENYWKGDYVEVFIDEDQSGGDHKFNHQAFAYHVSTEGHAIDQSTAQKPIFFDDHVTVKRTQNGNKHWWELAIRLYDHQFDENATNNTPVEIVPQKRIGFSIAYGDNDGRNNRENFTGSKQTHGVNNDEGYINSDVFGSILFVE